MGEKNLAGHGAEGFAKETRITADDDTGADGFLRSYVAGDAADGAAYIGKSEVFGHDCAPAGSAELDLGGHGFSAIAKSDKLFL